MGNFLYFWWLPGNVASFSFGSVFHFHLLTKMISPSAPPRLDELKKVEKRQFARFRPPDRLNPLFFRLFVRRQFSQCKQQIQDLLAETAELLCEYPLLLRGQIAREEGELRDSVDWIGRALKHNPHSPKFESIFRLLFELGKSHYLLAEHRRAIELFIRALEEQQRRGDNPDWKLFYWQSLATYHVFSPPECIKKAQDALLACPKINSSADMLMFLARLLSEQSEMGAAVEAYKRSIEMEPENVDLIHNLGMLYLKMEDQPNAFATFGKTLSYDPSYVPSMLALASVLQSNNDWDVALAKYKVAASDFDHSCALWNNIGMCFYGKGKLLAALVCLNKASYLCPLDWKVLINLAFVYFALRQFASAYHFAASAYAINPQNALILCTMALILTELNDFKNAKAAYKRALKLDPNLWVLRFNYAIFDSRRGNWEEAIHRLAELEAMGAGGASERAYPEELLQMISRIKQRFETAMTKTEKDAEKEEKNANSAKDN